MPQPTFIRAKCTVLGDWTVGKSSVVKMFLTNGREYSKNYNMTHTLEFYQKSIRIPDSEDVVELMIADVSGRDVYRKVLEQVVDPNMVIIAYDVSSEKSFKSVLEWNSFLKQVQQESTIQLPGVLLACKVDLTERREVTPKSGSELAEKLGFVYMECSAKENQNIEDAFFYLANEWHKIYLNNISSTLSIV